jgi:DNA-binding GntR family transcriptional regulator
MDAKTVRVRLTHDHTYEFIKDAITSLRFTPGQRLGTEELAQLVNASRTPVREALSRLSQEGLVHREGGWGYLVRQVSVKDVLDLYNVREALEVQAAREVVPKLTPTLIAELVARNRRAEEHFAAGCLDSFLAENRNFHKTIVDATGNALLRQMLNTIHDRVQQIGAIMVRMHQPRAKELLLGNRQILAALRQGDTERLVAAFRAHIRRGRKEVLRLVAGSAESALVLAAPAPTRSLRPPRTSSAPGKAATP